MAYTLKMFSYREEKERKALLLMKPPSTTSLSLKWPRGATTKATRRDRTIPQTAERNATWGGFIPLTPRQSDDDYNFFFNSSKEHHVVLIRFCLESYLRWRNSRLVFLAGLEQLWRAGSADPLSVYYRSEWPWHPSSSDLETSAWGNAYRT